MNSFSFKKKESWFTVQKYAPRTSLRARDERAEGQRAGRAELAEGTTYRQSEMWLTSRWKYFSSCAEKGVRPADMVDFERARRGGRGGRARCGCSAAAVEIK